MEIFYYYLTKELSKRTPIVIITECSEIQTSENLRVIPVTSRLFLIRRLGFGKISLLLSGYFQLFRHRKKIDVLHITTASSAGYYGMIFPLYKKITGTPYVVSFHGGGLHPWSKNSFFYPLFRHADKSVAISKVIQETLEKRTGNNFEFILPLVPFSISQRTKMELRGQYGIDERSKVLLMVGSIKPIKGSLFIAESFLKLGKGYLESNNLILIFAGSGEDSASIHKIAENEGCGKYIRLMGEIPNEKINELYSLSDIYIIASRFEGTPKSLLEAMFNQMPILASNVKGINAIITDQENGLLFEYNNSESFLQKLKIIIENKNIENKIRKEAKRYFELNYNYSQTVKKYEVLLNSVGANKRNK